MRRRLTFKLAGIAAALLLSPPLIAKPPEPYWSPAEVPEFGDWSVSCNNLNICIAGSFSRALVERNKHRDYSSLMEPVIWVARKADPLKPPVITLDYSAWGEVPQADSLKLHVYFSEFEDHGTDNDIYGRAYTLIEREPDIYMVAPDETEAFLAESRKSDQVAIRLLDRELSALVSTTRLTAALHYIDEQQGRENNETAMIAKGPGAWQLVTPRPKKPWVYSIGEVSEVILPVKAIPKVEKIREHACGVWLRGLGPEIHAYRLINGDRLWQIECQALLKNNPWTLWLVEKPDGNVLMPKLAPYQGNLQEPVITNGSFDPKTGVITSLVKMSEAGDCGEQGKWAWTGDRFELVEYRKMPSCLGLRVDQWFVLYETALGSIFEKPPN